MSDVHEDEVEASEPDEMLIKYCELKDVGKVLYNTQQYPEALQYFEEAYKIHQSQGLKKRIDKIKAHIADNVPEPNLIEDAELNVNEDDEPFVVEDGESFVVDDGDPDEGENDDFKAGVDLSVDDGATEVVDGLAIDKRLYSRLYPYQKEGVRWMWKLHKSNKGGILADDMGLGKTVQVIAFLTGLLNSKIIRSALIVMPVSLITNWQSEIAKWGNGFKTLCYHGAGKNRENNLSRIQNNGGVLLTSYGTLVSCVDKLKKKAYNGQKFSWDYIILDEGHKIKNPTKTTKAAHELSAHHRLVLSGTPIQNNLKELWALYDFCHQGTLLGNLATFKREYETPINKSREKGATAGQILLGTKMAENLRDLIKPYFLRRTKADTIEAKENVNPHSKSCAKLPRKNEFVVWLYLSPQQINIYEQFLKSDEVKRALMSTMSPLVQLVTLKKICDHPRLFTKRACKILALNDGNNEASMLNDSQEDQVSLNVESSLLLKESGKMKFLISLLETLREQRHRTLVFSMSKKILDIIEKILNERRFKLIRLDGSVTKLDDRQAIINKFQSNSNISVFLLTTQVGGVGLTLTEADRVVIYDPSWNPATDAQAVDRAYRIGQKKDVVVYRFITCGTIEEKIYRRQIFKDSITRQATSDIKQNRDPHRYFTNSELRTLFVLDEPTYSNTQVQLHNLHAHNRRTSPELNAHIKYLESLKDLLFGLSDHDLMFKGTPQNNDFIATGDENDYITKKVQGAQELLKIESKKNESLAKQKGTYKTTYFTENKGPFDRANFLVNDPVPFTIPSEDEDAEIIDLDSYLLEDEEDSILRDVALIEEIYSPKVEPKTNNSLLNKPATATVSKPPSATVSKPPSATVSKPPTATVSKPPIKAEINIKTEPEKSFFESIAENIAKTEPKKRCETQPEKTYFERIKESNMMTPKSVKKEIPKNKKSPLPLITSFFPKLGKNASTPKTTSSKSVSCSSSSEILDDEFIPTFKNKPLSSTSAECITIDSDSEDGLPIGETNLNTNSIEKSEVQNGIKKEAQDGDELLSRHMNSPKPSCSTANEFSPIVSKKRDALMDDSESDVSFVNPSSKRKKFNINFSDSDDD